MRLLDFGDDVALLRIEHDVCAHSLRHFHSNWIAIHADDERSAHQFRARRRTQADRSLRENHNRIADANVRRFRAAESSRCDVREQNHLLVGQLIGNLCEVRLRIGHKQIFRLRAVDRVAESPAADRFHTFAVTALRPLRGQTSPTLAARRDRADQARDRRSCIRTDPHRVLQSRRPARVRSPVQVSPDILRVKYEDRFRRWSLT